MIITRARIEGEEEEAAMKVSSTLYETSPPYTKGNCVGLIDASLTYVTSVGAPAHQTACFSRDLGRCDGTFLVNIGTLCTRPLLTFYIQ